MAKELGGKEDKLGLKKSLTPKFRWPKGKNFSLIKNWGEKSLTLLLN